MTFKEIEKTVERDGFGLHSYIGNTCISSGIKLYIEQETGAAETVNNALDRFYSGDYGNFYYDDEAPTPFNEYGQYPSIYGDDVNNGAIMIHRYNFSISIYFQFER